MDDICQEQFMELSYLNGGQEHGARGRGGMPIRGRGVLPGGAHRCEHPWIYAGLLKQTQHLWPVSCNCIDFQNI